MDAQIKARWIAALNSGEYKQGIGTLNSGGKFCCLGVLCEVLKEELELQVSTSEDSLVTYNDSTNFLPVAVKNYAGLTVAGALKRNVSFDKSTHGTLVSLNDNDMPFSEIAKVIDEQF